MPIAKLPSELLSNIFLLCADEARDDTKLRSRPYFAVSHVSKQWRLLARNTPLLWSSPDFSHPELALEMLGLSQDVPLFLNIGAYGDDPVLLDVACEALHHQSHAIKQLKLNAPESRLKEMMIHLTGPLPLLESVQLEVPDRFVGKLDCPGLEDGQHPRLDHLELVGCVLPWNSSCFNSIRSLTIDMSNALYGRPLDVLGILDVLQRNPKLTHLDLRNVLSWDEWAEAPPPLETVVPPSLTHLIIHNKAMHFHELVEAIGTPRLSYLEWKTWDHRYRSDDAASEAAFTELCGLLSDALDYMQATPYTIEACCTSTPAAAAFDAMCRVEFRILCARSTSADDSAQPLEIKFSFEHRPPAASLGVETVESPANHLIALLQSLHLDHLRTLNLDDFEHLPPLAGLFWETLATLPSLTVLSLKGNQILGVPVEMLEHLAPVEQEVSVSSTMGFFPALATLRYETDFEREIGAADWQSTLTLISSSIRRRFESDTQPTPILELLQSGPGTRMLVRFLGNEIFEECV